MTDVLIRGIAGEELQAIDAEASRLGLSRNEYLRREMRRIARHRARPPATAADYERSKLATADLADESVMGEAWS